jgi:hypothetical protein
VLERQVGGVVEQDVDLAVELDRPATSACTSALRATSVATNDTRAPAARSRSVRPAALGVDVGDHDRPVVREAVAAASLIPTRRP